MADNNSLEKLQLLSGIQDAIEAANRFLTDGDLCLDNIIFQVNRAKDKLTILTNVHNLGLEEGADIEHSLSSLQALLEEKKLASRQNMGYKAATISTGKYDVEFKTVCHCAHKNMIVLPNYHLQSMALSFYESFIFGIQCK